jgi:hypothetical protein
MNNDQSKIDEFLDQLFIDAVVVRENLLSVVKQTRNLENAIERLIENNLSKAKHVKTVDWLNVWWWQAENGQFGREKMHTFATV